MERLRIPVTSEPVDDCRECDAACCRANTVVHLTLKEQAFMTRKGNRFHTIASPAPYDREEVPYPRGHEYDPRTGKILELFFEEGRETEPLPANIGRFVLLNDCKYLEVDESGWAHCGAYTERPNGCVDFEAGSQKCHLMQLMQQIAPSV